MKEVPKFRGGLNIAIKIPKSNYQSTVNFYKNILKLKLTKIDIGKHSTISESHKVAFGEQTIWLDCVDNYTRSEVWMELKTADVEQAKSYLETQGISTCDEIEELPQNSHWIKDPAGTVFILNN